MRIRAGRYRHRIEIQAKTITRDAGGGEVPVWTTIADGARAAEIVPLTGVESYIDEQLQGIVTHKITTRYLDGVTNALRVVDVTRPASPHYFDVQSAINWGNRDRELSIVAIERLAE